MLKDKVIENINIYVYVFVINDVKVIGTKYNYFIPNSDSILMVYCNAM